MRTTLHAKPYRSRPLWLIPTLYAGVTVVSAFVLPRLEHEHLAGFSHSLSVSSALAALSAVASGMIALTGIVSALAFVMVQFSAVAHSPRLVAWFARDPLLFHSLGLFTATFLYAIAALAWTDRGGSGKVSLFSVLIVQALLILSVVAFARLVNGLNDLQIANVLHVIGRRGRRVIETMFPRLDAPSRPQPSVCSAPPRSSGPAALTIAAAAHSGGRDTGGRVSVHHPRCSHIRPAIWRREGVRCAALAW